MKSEKPERKAASELRKECMDRMRQGDDPHNEKWEIARKDGNPGNRRVKFIRFFNKELQ